MLVIRRASVTDSLDIFDWRNDEETRKASHNTDVVFLEQHEKWFVASLNNEERSIFIAEDILKDGKNKIAMVRFDKISDDGVVEVSINLNPKFRKMGFAKPSILLSIKEIYNFWKIQKIIAEIKDENIASARTFLGCGFKLRKKETGFAVYEFEGT